MWCTCTTDGWTSKSGTYFLSITIHFISEEFLKESYLLNIIPLNESHTSLNIHNKIFDGLQTWNLNQEQIICIVHDNAADMKKAFKDIFTSVNCIAHTL